MLLTRSIALLLLLGTVASQEYDTHYDHADYSKYFDGPSSATFTSNIQPDGHSSDYVTPSEYDSFFDAHGFDASPSSKKPIKLVEKEPAKSSTSFDEDFAAGFAHGKDPFSQDFFAKAQKERAAAEDDDHERLSDSSAENEDAKDESAEKAEADAPRKKYKYEYNIEHKPYAQKNYEESSKPVGITVTPIASGYRTKYTQTPQLTPYQKYSFQPVPAVDSYGLKTESGPYNPAYQKVVRPIAFVADRTENIPKSLKLTANNCQKVNKLVSTDDLEGGRFKRQAMDCFVCEDPKTGANYEQCSYSTEPESDSYFVGKAEKYFSHAKPISYRYKREAKDEKETEEKYENPYEYVKSKSHDYQSKPAEFDESSHYTEYPYEPVEEYKFGPEYFEDVEQERSDSEKYSEELKKNPANCQKVKKSGMTCMICKDEKSGANYEQCSYTSAPAEKKYAYVRERKFDKDDNPISDTITETDDPKELAEGSETAEKHVPKQGKTYAKHADPDSKRSGSRYVAPKTVDATYEVPSHFEKSTADQKQKATAGLDSKLYGRGDSSAESKEKETKKSEIFDYPELEEYHFKLFPQYNREESKTDEQRVKVPDIYKSFEADESKKDVEEVLAEFAKKDRSNCKKAFKKGMTCYLCVDKKGLENEECMYVSESQPKSSHIAYHELQKVNKPKPSVEERKQDGSPLESKIEETEQAPVSKRKRVFKKATSTEPSAPAKTRYAAAELSNNKRIQSAKAETTTTVPKERVARRLRRVKIVPKDEANTASKIVKRKADTVETPEEFKVGPEEGAFSTETKPVYSKKFGATLPRFMVEKTEYEVDFDKFSAH